MAANPLRRNESIWSTKQTLVCVRDADGKSQSSTMYVRIVADLRTRPNMDPLRSNPMDRSPMRNRNSMSQWGP
jgi:hypothetical protein